MASPFQDINKVVQWAVSDSKGFSEDLTEEPDEEELEAAIEEAYDFRDLGDYYKPLYASVFAACIETYVQVAILSED